MTETFPWPVQNIAEWMPFWQEAGFFLATFVLEDAAAVGAGLLLAAGAISWPVAFASCFLGIWIGDAGLYALARFGGRKWFEQSSFKKFSAKVARCEEWFAERGPYVLIFSRCVPGAAALVWTFIVLRVTQILGAQVVHWLNAYQHGGLILLAAGVACFAVFQLIRRKASGFDAPAFGARLERWRHWEFWPAWLFYPPVGIYCVWLAVKYRTLAVPTAANPGIFAGGMVGESKMATLKNLMQASPEFTAAAELVTGTTYEARRCALAEVRARLDLQFPFILKPDLGQRGAGVKLIRTQAQAEDYLRQTSAPLVAQRYAPGPYEAGIFYYRLPHEPHGKIFSITEKIFPVLTGDGRHTIVELIQRDARARLIAGTYLKRLAARGQEVLPAGEPLKLVESGNHAQGCIFRDGRELWSPELEARMDEISRKVDGFFIGRYDLRYGSVEDLRCGKGFQIVELNGAASEATNIYDARNSLWSAYRTLFRQWNLVFAIDAENRRRGFAPAKIRAVWRTWREYGRLAATYPAAD